MKIVQRISVVLAIVLVGFLSSSWGFLVHRTTHQLAIYSLPKALQPFFFSNMSELVKNSTAPDERRNKDTTEATKHFIDFEAFGDSAAYKMPTNWNDAVVKYSKDSLLKYGYVPYHIINLQEQLTNAFKAKDKKQILFLAADIGHYIEDAHVPLHTSINYDGQLTNQKGIHALWESVVPELEITNYNLNAKYKAQYIANPEQAVWQALQTAHVLLNDVLDKEVVISKSFTEATKYRIQNRRGKEVKYYTTDFAKAYGASLAPTINNQLIASANLVADFWYTAWVNAGKPDMEIELTAEQKQALKQQKKALKKNNLLQQNLLIAKKDTKSEE